MLRSSGQRSGVVTMHLEHFSTIPRHHHNRTIGRRQIGPRAGRQMEPDAQPGTPRGPPICGTQPPAARRLLTGTDVDDQLGSQAWLQAGCLDELDRRLS
ncbi:MAG: hypothetical protein ACRCTR_07105 [Actinomycetota bacterium]